MNDWNKTERFSRGFIDNDRDPVMELDLDRDGCVMNTALFLDSAEFGEASMGNFKTRIGM